MKKKESSNVSSFSTFSSNHLNTFILDSGSTSHIVSEKNLFIKLDKAKEGMINISCGVNTLKIEGKVSMFIGYKNKPVVLHNVLYVPKITVNLLSLHHLLLEQFKVDFSVNHFIIFKNNKLFLEGNYQSNIPMINFALSNQKSHLSLAKILHKSLGHISYRRIRSKLGIPVNAPEAWKLCLMVKITKVSFKTKFSSARKPFEEIHLDLIGPITPILHQKHWIILTIVDSYSCYVSAIPLCSKVDVLSVLNCLVDIESKRIGYHPSVFHSDWGTEFTKSKLNKYCQQHVIQQHFSDVYTHQLLPNSLTKRCFNPSELSFFPSVLWSLKKSLEQTP